LSLEAKEYLGSDREVINFVNKIEPSALLEVSVSAIKPYEGFGDVDHTIKELMSL
jgi:hypothetical protein